MYSFNSRLVLICVFDNLKVNSHNSIDELGCAACGGGTDVFVVAPLLTIMLSTGYLVYAGMPQL